MFILLGQFLAKRYQVVQIGTLSAQCLSPWKRHRHEMPSTVPLTLQACGISPHREFHRNKTIANRKFAGCCDHIIEFREAFTPEILEMVSKSIAST
jgi:hypothetical protein